MGLFEVSLKKGLDQLSIQFVLFDHREGLIFHDPSSL